MPAGIQRGDAIVKKKIWAASPVFYIISAAMLCMALFSWKWNRSIFVVEICIAVAAFVAVFLAVCQFGAYVGTAVKAGHKMLSGQQAEQMDAFTIPIALVGKKNDIVWVNTAFRKHVSPEQDLCGSNAAYLLQPHSLAHIINAVGTDVTVEGRKYAVFATETDAGCLLYFLDNTYYKDIERAYTDSRIVVCLALFDNRDELSRDRDGSEDNRIASEVERTLYDWARNMGGFARRLSSGRYLLLTDEVHIREAMEHRFEILDAVRKIQNSDKRSATISIGIARGAKNLRQAEQWARNALDMALGRGGDQVAVKQKDESYEFFGGLSKGVEKRDKVRTRVIAATLSDHVRQSDHVLIMGHKFGDLDCIGAAIGMWSAATRGLHTSAHVVVNRDQCMAKPLLDYMDHAGEGEIFLPPAQALASLTPSTLLIVVDTHNPDVVESQELLAAAQRVVVIDHHRMMVHHIQNALVFYHEPYASSAAELVAELVQYINDSALTRPEAEALLAGIMLDTKDFVLKTGVRTFEAAAYLRRRGADTVQVKHLFADNIETYKAKYRIVSGAELKDGCAIAAVQEDFPNLRMSAAQAADELLSIQGVDASFVIFPATGMVSVSARSMGAINVQLIMEEMGGGGHMTMAGAQLKNMTVAQVHAKLTEVLAAGVGRPQH